MLEWFPNIIAGREKFGFKVDFMYADCEHNQLVWAVNHAGDYEAAYEEFAASPERAAAFAGQTGNRFEKRLAQRWEHAHPAHNADVVL